MKSLGYWNWRHPPRSLWEMGRNIFVFVCIAFALYQLLHSVFR